MFDVIKRFVPARLKSEIPEIPRAPYALPRGVPALEADADALRRRLLVGIAFAAVLAGSAGFVAGRRGGQEPPPAQPRR